MVDQARKIEEQLLGLTEQITGKIQLAAWQALTTATPVDTGFARSMWTPTLGSAIDAPADRPADPDEARAQGRIAVAKNRAKAEAIARSYRMSQGPAFITNPVRYVIYLNEGSSSQAPAKFVERAIEAAIRSVSGSRFAA